MSEKPTRERVVVIHRARTATEAVVIRGLLESAGIIPLAPMQADPWPVRLAPKGFSGNEIQVLESQAEEARAILVDYLASASSDTDDERED